ncbi:hypothetical protein K1719_043230 [Acacia pycnantha]|nr:hypothetical protein K1719_043230 [Acacia pycnantha]
MQIDLKGWGVGYLSSFQQHCLLQMLNSVADEVAVSFQNDDNVVIAKLDATANDIPSETFDVQGYPTLYFRSSNGQISQYDGNRTKEDIIDFIEKNRISNFLFD